MLNFLEMGSAWSRSTALLVMAGSFAFGQYTVRTVAGGAPPDSVPGNSFDPGRVDRIAVDSAGAVYLTSSSNWLLKLTPDGSLHVVAGNGTIGGCISGPALGPILDFRFQGSIAVDPKDGSLYMTTNGCISKVSGGNATPIPGTLANSFYQMAIAPDGTIYFARGTIWTISKAQVTWSDSVIGATGIALDSSGALYVADTYQHSLKKIDHGVVTTIGGDGTPGFKGDGGPVKDAKFNLPMGLALDSAGNLYVADSGNHRVRKISNGIITTIAGTGVGGFTCDSCAAPTSQLNSPTSVAIDGGGILYIADSANHRVRKVVNNLISTVVGGSISIPVNTSAASTILRDPRGVALSPSGELYIADPGSNTIRKLYRGVVSLVSGDGTPGFSGDGGPAASARTNGANSVALDGAGNLYIADVGNNRVRKVSAGIITTVAGDGSAGYGGDDGPATQAKLNSPSGVAVDSAGNLYIADTGNHRIRVVSPSGVIRTLAGNGTLSILPSPESIAVDRNGDIYVSTTIPYSDPIIKRVSNGQVTNAVGGGRSGEPAPVNEESLSAVFGIALDADGKMFIAGANCVRQVSDGIIRIIAGNRHLGLKGDDGPALDAWFTGPFGIAVDPDGIIYVADDGRIRALIPPVLPSHIDPGGVVHAASGRAVLAPGSLATIYGDGFTSPLAISDNFTGNNSPGGYSVGQYGNGPDTYAIGYNFLIPASGDVVFTGGAYVGSFGSGTNTVNMILRSDSGGKPGAVLESMTLINVLTGSGTTVGFSSTLKPVLSAGQTYWLTSEMMAPSTSTSYWWTPSNPDRGPTASRLNGGAWVVSTGDRGAFRIFSAPIAKANSTPLPFALANVSVSLGGHPAPLLYVSPTQINFQAPYEVQTGTSQLIVNKSGVASAPAPVTIAPAAPGVFVYGSNWAVIQNANYSVNGPSAPARVGEYVTLYGTGAGAFTPSVATGTAAPSSPLAQTSNTVTASINGVPARVTFSGLTPETVGLLQVNLQIPEVPAGSYPIQISVNGASSNTPSIAVIR